MRRLLSLKNIIRIPELIRMIYWSIYYFRSPYKLWRSYILQNKPNSNFYELRNGYKIILSDNPHDSITVMVIFCRKEYGDIKKGSTVIDVGSNIGVFTLYALMHGAKKVVAIEPNNQSFELLRKNIKLNGLNDKVVLLNKAVGSVDGSLVYLPINSSPYNEVSQFSLNNNTQPAYLISLETLIKSHANSQVDLLKVDCEGAEYDFLYSAEHFGFNNILSIKMEIHGTEYERNSMLRYLERQGFSLVKAMYMIRWFVKK